MKSRILAAAVVATSALALSATAGLAGSHKKVCTALAAVDPDNDGKLDLSEAQAAAGKVFAKLDPDKDGTLDRKELRGRLSGKEIAAGDPDKDKSIDKSEYLAIVAARFKAADPDGDGTLDCKELHSKAGRALLRLIR